LLLLVGLSMLTLSCQVSQAVPAAKPEKTAQGIIVQPDEGQAELAVTPSGAFRLSVSYAGIPKAHPSIFLDETSAVSSAAWETVEKDGRVGVKSAAGQLLFNPETKQWMVLNARGQTIIPPQSIGKKTGPDDESTVSLNVGWDRQREFFAYGCGNYESNLMQKKGNSRQSNGKALIPYYWSAAGYALLGVSECDESPAAWEDRSAEGAITWSFAGQSGDLYIMPAADLYEALDSLTQLTGRPKVPPKWVFGYLQCRWGWEDRAYIEDVLKNFIDRKLPVDAFIYDFEWYTDTPDYKYTFRGDPDFKDFGWNPKLFPEPAEQIKQYRQQGVHTVGIRKPRLANAGVLTECRKKGMMLNHTPDGEPRVGGIHARDMDFKQAAVREWYGEQHKSLFEDGVDGWWNDEGEASYSLYANWNLAQVEAQAKYRPNTRYWSLNRAFSPGLARTGASVWTGDIRSTWKTLEKTPTDLLNWSLGGMPYGTCDIGGFKNSPEMEMTELLVRWMQVGTFMPLMRTHSERTMIPRFPWLYEGAEAPIRKALELRYRLIPMIYSLAHEGHATGAPIMRPLVMEFPADAHVADCSSQWLLGTGLMAAPILSEGGTREVYLPADKWYPFEKSVVLEGPQTLQVTAKLDEIPVYVRAGTILPMGPVVQNTSVMPGGPLDLQIYPGKDTTFTLLEDDGKTYDYLKGAIRKTTFSWDNKENTLSWNISGNYKGENLFKSAKVTVFYPGGKKQAEITFSENGRLAIDSAFQP
ncbi:MAG: TIM-barrel domain-containing protein, partial [Planctomycetota bacterium]